MRRQPFTFVIDDLPVYMKLEVFWVKDGQTLLLHIGPHTEGRKKRNFRFTQQLPYNKFRIADFQVRVNLLLHG